MFTLARGYRRSWLRGDIVAGVTVAAIAIPESLGYATIAGLPVQTGLYCALLPAVVFALIASSRQLVVGADSATAAGWKPHSDRRDTSRLASAAVSNSATATYMVISPASLTVPLSCERRPDRTALA